MKPENAVRLDRTVGPAVYRLHRLLYRVTGGRIGARSGPGPILLLTTTGRKTGRPRTVPLLYMPDAAGYVVVASNGGRDEPPAWLGNLLRDPDCTLQVGRQRVPARAEILSGREKAARWDRVTAFYAGWAHYQTLTARDLPVVVLRPVAGPG